MPDTILRHRHDASHAHTLAMHTCLAALRTLRLARSHGCPPGYVARCAADLARARRAARETRRVLRLARAMAALSDHAGQVDSGGGGRPPRRVAAEAGSGCGA